MGESTKRLRKLWKKYECKERRMVLIPFGPDRIRVAPPTAPAWEALAGVLRHHGYRIRSVDTDSYNCRNIKGTNNKSLHSFGIALDVNWRTNPWIGSSRQSEGSVLEQKHAGRTRRRRTPRQGRHRFYKGRDRRCVRHKDQVRQARFCVGWELENRQGLACILRSALDRTIWPTG